MSCITANCVGEPHGIFPECKMCFETRHKNGTTYKWSPSQVGLDTITRIFDSYPGLVQHNIGIADINGGVKSRVTIIHNACGKSWDVTINRLINEGVKCPSCIKQGKSNKVTQQNDESTTCDIPECSNKQHGIFPLCKQHFMEKYCPKAKFKWTPANVGYNTVVSVLRHYIDIINFDDVKLEDIDAGGLSWIKITHLMCEQTWRVKVKDLMTTGMACPNCKLKWTYDYVKEQLKDRTELDLSDIKRSDVRGCESRIPVSCTKCGHKWKPEVYCLVNGSGCQSCAGTLPWTAQRLRDRPDLAAEYDMSEVSDEQIVNGASKIPITHKPCNYRREVSIRYLVSHHPCPRCSKYKPWSLERFMDELKDTEHFDLSMVMEEHVKSPNNRVPLICKICQHYWEPTIYSLVYGNQGCPSCAGKLPWTLSRFQEHMSQRPDIDASAITIEHFVNSKSKVPLTCLLCEYKWSPPIGTLIYFMTGCPQCAGNAKWTLKRLQDRLNSRLDISLEQVTEEMISGNTSCIPVICTVCQNNWSISISSLIRGTGCPKCRTSKGIQSITTYLDSKCIVYELEKTFPGLVYKSSLRIDVYIEVYPKVNLPICIEYDGNYPGSHFRYTNSKEKTRHQNSLIRDNIKDDWVLSNNKHMVRIPYTCFKSYKQAEMDSVLDEAFSYLSDLEDPNMYYADYTPYQREESSP